MKLYFSNEDYKAKALSTKRVSESKHTVGDAFMLLVKDVSKEDLSNLTKMMSEYYGISEDGCYSLTQGIEASGVSVDKETIADLAYKCIESGKTLGEKTIQGGKWNTSSWMSHVLYEGKLAKEFATKLGLDPVTAQIQGILHDYGRKTIHNLEHVTKGYEKLIDEGWEDEAPAALTHSFLNGGRCASNDQAEEGFFVDENGNPCWKLGSEKDDITLFLENYEYTEYDDILNVSDLMATSDGIVSPYDRIQDIATRRTLDPTNRGYFLAEFTNKLVEFLEKTGAQIPEDIKRTVKADQTTSLDELNENFKVVSDVFYEHYKNNISLDTKVSVEEISEVASQTTVTQMANTQKTMINLASKVQEEEQEK